MQYGEESEECWSALLNIKAGRLEAVPKYVLENSLKEFQKGLSTTLKVGDSAAQDLEKEHDVLTNEIYGVKQGRSIISEVQASQLVLGGKVYALARRVASTALSSREAVTAELVSLRASLGAEIESCKESVARAALLLRDVNKFLR